jgi:poly(3-hydroxybutyrate) depolymerase
MPPFSYEMHEMAHLAWAPARAVSDTWLEHPGNPLSYTAAGRNLAKIFERLTRRFDFVVIQKHLSLVF